LVLERRERWERWWRGEEVKQEKVVEREKVLSFFLFAFE